MDLQDFAPEHLYYDRPSPPGVEQLIAEASRQYAVGDPEPSLQRALRLAPDDLAVLVALYRFYYYRHRHAEALVIAHRAMAVVAPLIDFPADWRQLDASRLAAGVAKSFTLVRFYLMALKGAALLQLRLGAREEGAAMLGRVSALDTQDRLGAAALLRTVAGNGGGH